MQDFSLEQDNIRNNSIGEKSSRIFTESEQMYHYSVLVAKMYYYQNLNTSTIAKKLDLSRSKVSRLLNFARRKGLVEIKVHDYEEYLSPLGKQLKALFGLKKVHIVPVEENALQTDCLHHVAKYTASYLNTIVENNMIIGLAWGTTLSTISDYLIPKNVRDVDIIQLNGSGNTKNINNLYASEIILHFAENYRGKGHLFPVPTFFDYEETKRAMWRERSIRNVLDLQEKADILLYSLGAVDSGMPSHVYAEGYLEIGDYQELEEKHVVADLATVFFTEDGRYDHISINKRASGPDLGLYKRVPRAICIVSGKVKAAALHTAMACGYMNEVIVDEPTARFILTRESERPLANRINPNRVTIDSVPDQP